MGCTFEKPFFSHSERLGVASWLIPVSYLNHLDTPSARPPTISIHYFIRSHFSTSRTAWTVATPILQLTLTHCPELTVCGSRTRMWCSAQERASLGSTGEYCPHNRRSSEICSSFHRAQERVPMLPRPRIQRCWSSTFLMTKEMCSFFSWVYLIPRE